MASAFESLADAINDLVECQNTDHEADHEKDIVLAQTPPSLTEEINKIESKFEQLQTAVRDHGPGYRDAVSLKLDVAFEELYHLAVFIGLIVFGAGSAAVGLTLVFVGAGSMLAAALVLALSSRELLASALKQGTLPLLGVLCLTVGVLI